MQKHVVARESEMPPGSRRRVIVNGRPIAVFNVAGSFYGLLDRCPHQGASLCAGLVTGLAVADRPGRARIVRQGEMVRCPWHGWEFDIRTGQSWCAPGRFQARAFAAGAMDGADVVKGPYVAETVPVSVEDRYVVVEA